MRPSFEAPFAAHAWVPESRLKAQEEFKGLSIEESRARMEEMLCSSIQTLADEIDPSVPAILMTQVNGLITFPSFHAALGLILIYVTRGIRVLFPISLGLNVLMIAATPTVGGHYFVDVLAGLAVVPLAIMLVRCWNREKSTTCMRPLAVDR